MQYGFVIDNRKCIGCHACTVACKSEHDVPVGVNRTWVKQTEKGEFPNTSRSFSVLRCNHCSDAPCVSICPTQALFTREDGIVDFDNERCIGCKSCMQACPYDALYIDPETHTAAKCNYCAHRVDVGLEPACVVVCPEEAIVSGNLQDPNSKISQLVSGQQVSVRKPEKGTQPNLFYINGDETSLNPNITERSESYIWSSQSSGVGHFSGKELPAAKTKELPSAQGLSSNSGLHTRESGKKSVSVLMQNASPKRVYDTPDKGILWGWEVSAYVWTKAISAGVVLAPALGLLFGAGPSNELAGGIGCGVGLLFLLLTGLFLVLDLDQPKRFLYVLLRPQWGSWLVRGGYAISFYGLFLALFGLALYLDNPVFHAIAFAGAIICAAVVAVYTAFLFAQAKGRDFWQSPALGIHMLLHSLIAGLAVYALGESFLSMLTQIEPVEGASHLNSISNGTLDWSGFLRFGLIAGFVLNLLVMFFEIVTPHPTEDAKATVKLITKGPYAKAFWGGVVFMGNVFPLIFAILFPQLLFVAAILFLAGLYVTERIWVEAPQRIVLT